MMRGLESQMRGLALTRTLAAMRTLRWAVLYGAAARIWDRGCSATLLQSFSMVSWHFVSADFDTRGAMECCSGRAQLHPVMFDGVAVQWHCMAAGCLVELSRLPQPRLAGCRPHDAAQALKRSTPA